MSSQALTICNMELRQLRYFVAAAQTGSFSEAARTLYITQGTLSQQIRQLEDEMGTPLFIRRPHNVELSEAGRELLPLAQRTLADAESCSSHMRDLKDNLSGTLNIGVTTAFRDILADTVREFVRRHPGVKLRLFCKPASELAAMLLRREVDFIMAFKPARLFPDIESEDLLDSRLCVVMRDDHVLADREGLSLDDLRGFEVILPGGGLQARKAFEKFVDVDTSGLDVKVELNDPDTIFDLVRSANLLSVITGLAALYQPGIHAVPLKDLKRPMHGGMHWLKDEKPGRCAQVFMEMIRDSAYVRRARIDLGDI